jgi:hypothetical protein
MFLPGAAEVEEAHDRQRGRRRGRHRIRLPEAEGEETSRRERRS